MAWPFVCSGCGEHYASYIVYARFGRQRQEYPTCSECGPKLPVWVEGRFDEVWHTILMPVPESYHPRANPYPSASKETHGKNT